MTLTQYKKIIAALSREDLENHLFELFKANKVFKDIESTVWDASSNEKLLEECQKKLKRVFWKNSFSLSECKSVLKDYLGRTMDKRTIALMNLAFAREAAHLSRDLGEFESAFYTALENAAEKTFTYAKTDKKFFEEHEDEFDDLLESAGCFGYGVKGSLEDMLDEVREELYGED